MDKLRNRERDSDNHSSQQIRGNDANQGRRIDHYRETSITGEVPDILDVHEFVSGVNQNGAQTRSRDHPEY